LIRWRVLGLAIAVSAGCNTHIEPGYCGADIQCSHGRDEPGWRCIFDGDSGAYCAQPDTSCPSGLRWSQSALESLIGKCVDPALLVVDMAQESP
jgi:hypothetical protein